jgi:hypothetical protein
LTRGVAAADVADGAMLLGHAQGKPVLVVRRGDDLFAVGDVRGRDAAGQVWPREGGLFSAHEKSP